MAVAGASQASLFEAIEYTKGGGGGDGGENGGRGSAGGEMELIAHGQRRR